MKKETVLTALEKALNQSLGEDYDYAIDFDSFRHRIAIYFRIFVENKDIVCIEDTDGTVATDIIEFEDSILFHQAKDKVDETEYLETFIFDRKKGISRAMIEAIAMTLRETLDEGQSDLMDFVTDSHVETFELHFDQDFYTASLERAKKRYHNEMVSYPKF